MCADQPVILEITNIGVKKSVSLEQMKQEKSFKDWELLRIGRLSVMPVPKNIWDKIIKLSQ